MALKLGLLHKPIGKDWTPFICGVSHASYTSAGTTSSPMTKFFAIPAYLKYHSLFANEDPVFSAMLPDSRTLYQPIRSFESAPRREMVSGCHRNGDVPVVGHLPPGFTSSAMAHTGVTATEALQLVEDRPFWQMIATAGGFG